MPSHVFYDSRSYKEATRNSVHKRATRPLYSYIYVRTIHRISESRSAGVETVQAQGWSVVERKQAFAELEAAKKLADAHHGCCLTWIYQ